MAKGEKLSNRETRKPKAEKPKTVHGAIAGSAPIVSLKEPR